MCPLLRGIFLYSNDSPYGLDKYPTMSDINKAQLLDQILRDRDQFDIDPIAACADKFIQSVSYVEHVDMTRQLHSVIHEDLVSALRINVLKYIGSSTPWIESLKAVLDKTIVDPEHAEYRHDILASDYTLERISTFIYDRYNVLARYPDEDLSDVYIFHFNILAQMLTIDILTDRDMLNDTDSIMKQLADSDQPILSSYIEQIVDTAILRSLKLSYDYMIEVYPDSNESLRSVINHLS